MTTPLKHKGKKQPPYQTEQKFNENNKKMKKYKVVETNNVNGIVREIKNLNVYQAEDTYFKILNTNPVRSGYNNVKIINN